jgi:hypothetical protein
MRTVGNSSHALNVTSSCGMEVLRGGTTKRFGRAPKQGVSAASPS